MLAGPETVRLFAGFVRHATDAGGWAAGLAALLAYAGRHAARRRPALNAAGYRLTDPRACCARAESAPCVCALHTRCPEHGERHHGTHD